MAETSEKKHKGLQGMPVLLPGGKETAKETGKIAKEQERLQKYGKDCKRGRRDCKRARETARQVSASSCLPTDRTPLE